MQNSVQGIENMWQIAGVTECGPFREQNEDAIDYDANNGLLVLADGMGGHNAGEVASAIVVKEVMGLLRQKRETAVSSDNSQLCNWLKDAAETANYAVYSAANSNVAYENMGATLVAVVLSDNHVCISHVGDSRAYMYQNRKLRQLTRDHTLLQAQIDAGLVPPDYIPNEKSRSPLIRGMGNEETVEVDVGIFKFGIDDVLLVSSDGLFEPVSDVEIMEILQQDLPLASKARALTDLAIEKGGRDNVSVLLACHKA